MRIFQSTLALLLLLGWMGCTSNSSSTAQAQIFEDLEPTAFQAKYQEAGGQILDVRTPPEVAEGVIEGAMVINIQDSDFSARIDALDKTKAVFVYCKAGGRSARASGMLEKLGFTEVYNLDGGITAWKAAGLPVATNN